MIPKHAQVVSKAIASWADVHARTHWLLGDETEVAYDRARRTRT